MRPDPSDILASADAGGHAGAWGAAVGPIATVRVLHVPSVHQAPRVPPARQEVLLWGGAPAASAAILLARCEGVLAPAERARVDRFRREADAREYIAAHAGLRLLLGAALGCAPLDLQFVDGPHGKPELAGIAGRTGHPAVHFNLSHTRGRVLLGVSGSPIGVDVEVIADTGDLMHVARRVFSPETVASLEGADGARRTRLFYRFWTLGEAFIKATGRGIGQGLDTFAFSAEGEPRLERITPGFGPASRWRFGLIGD